MNPEPNTPKGGIAGRLSMAGWRKHYVATMTADEEAWPHREPGGNLGRVFIILLLLHVFLIGAVVLYNVVSPKTPPAPVAIAKPPAAKSSTPGSPDAPGTAASNTAAGPAAPAPPKPDVKPTEMGTYEIRSGDNVPGIAAALAVLPEDLIKLNNLDSTSLYPGRKLIYPRKPAAPPAARTSQVPLATRVTPPSSPSSLKTAAPAPANQDAPPKPAPTAETGIADAPPKASAVKPRGADQPPAIAKSTARDEPSGAPRPKAEPKKTEPAKTAVKPDAKKSDPTAKTAAKPEKSSKETAGRRLHSVGPKETLYSIARKYGVKVEALQKINGIKDPTALRDGVKLVIPPKN